MQKINYQKILDELIEKLQKENKIPKLLLHSCCAPCSSYVLEYLSKYFRITVLYYNPNISIEEEYLHRIEEQKRLISEMKTINEVDLNKIETSTSEIKNIVSSNLEDQPDLQDILKEIQKINKNIGTVKSQITKLSKEVKEIAKQVK